MATGASPNGVHNTPFDRYVVIHVATTCDEHGVYVTKDSAEVIEIGWILLNGKTLDEVDRGSQLVKPINTPITPLCTSLTTLQWDNVRSAGTFRDAINAFDQFAQENLLNKNLNFCLVTMDAWDLRVQLPREARDKAVVLPPYLQHSCCFDLRTEYQRWQAHHTESLPFGPSSITNICAALEVEPVQNAAPIKHNLPFHLQSLAPPNPRRAMEEAVTLARILKGLVRKSQPAHEHPDVLVRPMDARADVRAFLAERSKILHMSGLPHDTTQSELESWFTQYGGRPIAFWTLRTPDQHKPTGTGFAVFSSHEEAAESLCMNGRALSEKAIEVSPSSSRVLDRATEILTPFPPSKNRPRPGDWTCPSCGFSNFQRRTACFRCSYPAIQANPGDHFAGFSPYGFPPHGMIPPHLAHGRGHGPGRGNHGGGIVPFRAGDWQCGSDGCGYHNFAKNTSCLRCGASRAGAAVIADNAFGPNMDSHPPYSMGPGAMAGTSGPNSFGAAPGGFPGPAGFGNGGFGTPQSSFGLPSGLTTPGSSFAPVNGPMAGGMMHTSAANFADPSPFPSAGPPSASGTHGMFPGPNRSDFSYLEDKFGNMNVSDQQGRASRPNGSEAQRA